MIAEPWLHEYEGLYELVSRKGDARVNKVSSDDGGRAMLKVQQSVETIVHVRLVLLAPQSSSGEGDQWQLEQLELYRMANKTPRQGLHTYSSPALSHTVEIR